MLITLFDLRQFIAARTRCWCRPKNEALPVKLLMNYKLQPLSDRFFFSWQTFSAVNRQYWYYYVALSMGAYSVERPSVGPSVPCLRFSQNRKAIETSNLEDNSNQGSTFEV